MAVLTNHLPSTISKVYAYRLNTDGTITALYNNQPIGPLTANYASDYMTYVDSTGKTVIDAQTPMVGCFQTTNGFLTYVPGPTGIVFYSNDKIEVPANIHWANQSGVIIGNVDFPAYCASTDSIILKDFSGRNSVDLDAVSGGANAAGGTYSATAHAVMPGVQYPDGYLPSTISSVYIYVLNPDGSVTATNNNLPVGPIRKIWDGSTWSYVDSNGLTVTSSPNAMTGLYQSDNSFVVTNNWYDPSAKVYPTYLVTNDKIADPTKVKWSNQSGAVPGSTSFTSFTSSTTSIVLSSTTPDQSLSLSKYPGGVTVKGVYDPTAHETMPGAPLPDTYLPSTLNNVYIYLLNNDGTVSATHSNNVVGPLTKVWNGTTWSYVDATGATVTSSVNAMTGVYQTENGFIISSNWTDPATGLKPTYLVSNDKITDPTLVKWANQANAVPGTGGFSNFISSTTAINLTDDTGKNPITLSKVTGGVVTKGTYDPTAHDTMPGVPAPSTYLPSTLNNVYIYVLNPDGTVTATHNNLPVGPLKKYWDGTTWTYVDTNGLTVTTSAQIMTGVYQTPNGFVVYNNFYDGDTGVNPTYLVSNDKIADPSIVKWSNQWGDTPGSTAFPTFVMSSLTLNLTDSKDSNSLTLTLVPGGVTTQGTYDPTAHVTMPGTALPDVYLPTTLDNIYVYLLNTDGTIKATHDNTAIGPLTAKFDGTNWTYSDAAGNVVLTSATGATGLYQTENGFVSYNATDGMVLFSNDKIADPTKAVWANQNGAVPGTTSLSTFTSGSTAIKLADVNGTTSLNYGKVAGGVVTPGVYDASAHQNMPCFLEGTRILTAAGYKNVEALSLNDQVAVFRNGETIWRPIKALALGVCQVNAAEHDDRAGYPVVIRQGALAHGVPFKDLRVTADHAIEVEGRLFLARSLVDGEKVYFDKSVTTYRYFHIDLHDHEVIEADGARVESYGDDGYRALFDTTTSIVNTALSFDTAVSLMEICVDSGAILAMREKLGLKEMQDEGATPDALNFHLVTEDGQELLPRSMAGSRYSFLLPEHVSTVRMVSAAAQPYDVIGVHRDDRRALGVLIGEITVFEASAAIRQDSHLLDRPCVGWTALENDQCRWTKGDARLDLEREDTANAAIISIDVLDDCVRFGRS